MWIPHHMGRSRFANRGRLMKRFAMLASASAVAFVFAIGSVSAADFTTLKRVKAVPMSAAELNAVKGMDHHFGVRTPAATPNTVTGTGTSADGLLNPPASDSSAPQTEDVGQAPGRFETDWLNEESNSVSVPGNTSVAPSYLGLSKACFNGVIAMPGFVTCL